MATLRSSVEDILSGDPVLVDILQNLGATYRRVILVANNKNVRAEDINQLNISSNDLVIQFNRCELFRSLSHLPAQMMILFRRHFDTSNHHGFPCSIEIAGEIQKDPSRYWFMFTGIEPEPSVWAEFIQRPRFVVLNDSQAMRCIPEYPLLPDVPFSAPSSGYFVMRVLLALREAAMHGRLFGWTFRYPRALAPRSSHYQIVLLGFQPSTGPAFWNGHNWAFERKWLREARQKMLRGKNPYRSNLIVTI